MNFEKKFKSSILKITTSTRSDGDMSIGVGEDIIKKFLFNQNLDSFFSDMTQDHGIVISQATLGARSIGDGIWIQEEGVGLIIRTADCLPVVLFDSSSRLLMSLHCGFRGVRDGIIDEAVGFLKRKSVDLSVLFAFLGPCICSNCYTVDRNRYEEFVKTHPNAVIRSNGEFYIDIRKAVMDKLIANGIVASNVQQLERCTKEDRKFYSYRNGDKNERFITVAQTAYV